ncbi:MAG: hypothetical protein JW755_12670 [Candidatus Aminicenantes bacterium]|nr:hypothetical protein [Candidatus Aminicenantes bacterium]
MKNEEVFHSWKEIAAFLNREVRTCLRWEKELNLPVHRINKDSTHSKVFAYKSEIENWLQEKAGNNLLKSSKNINLKYLYFSFLLIAVIIAIALVYINFPRSLITDNSDILSMAVFPFQNNNPSPNTKDYLTDGIVQEISKSFTNLNSIRVIPVFSSDTIKLQNKNPLDISMGLGAKYMLTGLIDNQDSNIHIMVQLIRVTDAKKIYSHEYEEHLNNFHSLKTQINSNICECLNIKPDIRSHRLNSMNNTMTGEMWDGYFMAKNALAKIASDRSEPEVIFNQGKSFSVHNTRETNEIAISFFQKALEINENFAPAYIGLAECFSNYVNFNWDFNIKWLDHAESLLEKAQAFHPDLPDYFTLLTRINLIRSIYFNQKVDRLPIDIAEEGLKYYPHYPELNSIVAACYYHRYGQTGNEMDLITSLEYRKKSYDYNPISFQNIKYAELLLLNKKFDLAIDICRSLHDLDASGLIKFMLGEIYYYKGNLDEAERIFQNYNGTSEDKACALFYLAMIASQKDEHQKAADLIKEIELLAPIDDNYFDDYLKMASIYIGLGDTEKGYDYLKLFFDMESSKNQIFIYLKYIELDKNFDAIRDTLKFKDIIIRPKEELWVKANPSE